MIIENVASLLPGSTFELPLHAALQGEETFPDTVELACRLVAPLLQADQLSNRRFAQSVLRAAEETRRSLLSRGSMSPRSPILTPRQLKQAQQYMMDHLSEKLSVKEIASVCHLSASHFSRSFRGSCGDTPQHWLLQQRIQRAKQLLGNSHLTMPEIALECGFTHRVAFSKAFARVTGVGPAAWRRSHRIPIHQRFCSPVDTGVIEVEM